MTSTIFLSLGSNIGSRLANLYAALRRMAQVGDVVRVSSVHETAAWGETKQPDFLNLCAELHSDLSPEQLLQYIRTVEQDLGRSKTYRWGPRRIDIDILLYDNVVTDEITLTIPHPHLHERAFVLIPLTEIAPHVVHPVFNKTIASLELPTVQELALGNSDAIGSQLPIAVAKPVGNAWCERTYVMGILNVTPDSFSGDGIMQDGVAASVEQAQRFVNDGADILDIGGESTRPNGEPVTGEMERERVIPAIRAVRAALPNVTISIDTYRAETARQALAAGANWINDIWGLKQEPDIADVAAAAGCPIVMMHNGRNRERQNRDDGAGGYYGYWHYDDVVAEVKAELLESAEIALRAGVASDNIILDPGIGFGKTQAQNLTLLRRLDEIAALGFPLLLGTSRKGFIGQVLGGLPAPDRVEGTLATTALGIASGANIVRVHDVKENVRVARVADAIKKGGK